MMPGHEYDADYKAVGDHAEYYTDVVQFTEDINHYTLYFLSLIDEITSYDATECTDDACTWGPWQDTGLDQAQSRFIMTLVAADTYDYMLQWRPKNSDSEDDWKDIWTGHVVVSTTTARRGEGYFTIDFTTANDIDWMIEELGVMHVDYNTVSDGRQIDIEFVNFIPDYEDLWWVDNPFNADYRYVNHDDNTGSFTFDWMDDIHYDEFEGADHEILEHMWFNTRWQANGVGRSDLIVTDGDLPADFDLLAWKSSECWDSAYLRTYYTESGVDMAGGETVVPDSTEGDDMDCAFDAQWPQPK